MKVKWLLRAGLILGVVLYVLGLVLLGTMRLEAGAYALAAASFLLVITASAWIIRRVLNRIREKGGADMEIRYRLALGLILGIILYFVGLFLWAMTWHGAAGCAFVLSFCLLIGTTAVRIVRRIRNRKRKGG